MDIDTLELDLCRTADLLRVERRNVLEAKSFVERHAAVGRLAKARQELRKLAKEYGAWRP